MPAMVSGSIALDHHVDNDDVQLHAVFRKKLGGTIAEDASGLLSVLAGLTRRHVRESVGPEYRKQLFNVAFLMSFSINRLRYVDGVFVIHWDGTLRAV